jgi:hypothetical protein
MSDPITQPKINGHDEMHLFKSRADVMGYVFKTGKSVHFMQGQYATTAKDEIEELTTECENGHPNFYIDPKQVKVSKEELDPMHKIRAQIREEERAKLLAATDINRDMGTTDQNAKLTGISNSVTVAGAIAGSESQAVAANPNAVRPSIVIPKK